MYSEDWGGKREGAGRKVKLNGRTVRVDIRLDPEDVDWLASVTDNRSEFIAAAISLAREQNLVVLSTDKFTKKYGEPEDEVALWSFRVLDKDLTFKDTYTKAVERAIAAALENNVRLVELVKCR